MLKSKIAKNAIWIIACKMIQIVLNLVVTMISARYFGPSGYGLISYAASLVAFVSPIMKLGFNSVLVQETVLFAKDEGKIYGTAIVTSFCSAIACMLGLFGFANFVHAGEQVTILVCSLYSVILMFEAIELIQYWFQAKYLSKYFSLISLFAYVIVTAYKIFLLASGQSIYLFAISNAIDYFLIDVGLICVYFWKGGKRLKFSWTIFKRMFQKSKHYIVSTMMVTILGQTDKIMINLMLGEAATGYYSAAFTCAGMTSFIFLAIIDSFRPAIFEEKGKSEGMYKHNIVKLYSVIIYFALAQSLVITVFAKPVIHILYGEDFKAAIPTLMVVVWYSTFSYLGNVRNIWILAENKQKYLWIINLSGASINVILNFALIPLLGVIGAAVASLITQFFTNVVMSEVVRPLKDTNRLMIRSLNPKIILQMLKRKK